ncbi:MAG: PAS domain S-box protein [Desulfobacteraceae bacterium]|nr:PAS domain S-box protein [Desulfobacteraceae bacterium]
MPFSGNLLEKTAARILAIALSIIALFLIFLFAFIFPVVQDALFDSRKMAVKNLVDSVCSMLADYQSRVENGGMDQNAAQQAAMERIRHMRFTDNGYIWINDNSRPFPRMIMHPAAPELEGQVMDDPSYETAVSVQMGMAAEEKRFEGDKRHFFLVFSKVADVNGSGFVEYFWYRPTPEGLTETLHPKKSYVRLFEPWDWIVGTGVYIDDVYARMNRLKWTIISMGTVIFLIALIGTVFLMRTITGPIHRLVGFATDVAGGDYHAEIPGHFRGEMRQLKQAISTMVHELRTRIQEAEIRAREAEAARQALKNSQQRFQLALRGTNDGIWEWDLQTNEVFFSRRWKEIIGCADHELENRLEHWQDRIHPDDYNRVTESFNRFYESGALQFEVEYRLRHKDGTYRWVLGRAACLRDSSGKPVRLAGAHTDITDKKQAENTLRQSEEKYRLMFENAPLGVLHFDAHGLITECNDRFLDIIGSARDKLVGLNMLELPDKNVVSAVDAALRGRPGYYEGLYSPVTSEKQTPVRAMFAPSADSTGKIVGGIGMIEDITERKKAEEALRQSEEKYRVVVENAKEAIFVIQDGVLKFANKTTKFTGYSIEELSSRQFVEFIHPADRAKVRENYLKRLEGQSVPDYEYRIIDRSGDVKWVELKAVTIQWEGRPATLNFLSDISQQKATEEERQKLERRLRQSQKIEALGTLTGGVAHDFNNILSIIMGYTELVQSEIPKDHPAAKSLHQISAAGLRAKDVVRQLLTFNRKGGEEKCGQDISLVVREGLRMMRSTIASYIEIREDISRDLPQIWANPTQIHQLIINLCKNAADAMADKGGTLRVSLSTQTLSQTIVAFGYDLGPGDYVKLTVFDTGHGISGDTLERIFDPYFTTKEVDKGTGLGLSVVLGIVRDLGGGIRVESQNGSGSCFEVYFPALQEAAPSPAPERSSDLPGGNERILLIDDEHAVIQLNETRLQRLGYSVECRRDPVAALQAFAAAPNRFDLVITDMTMPGMTGDVLAREILKIRTGMKIILCTGYSEKISEDSARELGIARYMEKPVSFTDLAAALRDLLDQSDEAE